jgi:hypothetical protein
VSIALNGLAPSWKPFVQGVCAREHLPNYAKLWDNLVQEDIRLESRSEQQNKVEDIALVGRTMKGSKKGDKKGNKKDSSPENQYFSQIQCFRCHQLGHYASQCPEKKGKAKSLLYWIGSFNFNWLKGGKELTHDCCHALLIINLPLIPFTGKIYIKYIGKG